MPLEDASKVDAIGTDRGTGSVVLNLFDAWDWSDARAHLSALQAKLNAYFDFIQSGQIREAYPSAEGKPLVIQVITKFPVSLSGEELLRQAASVASQLNVTVCHLHFDGTASAFIQCSGLESIDRPQSTTFHDRPSFATHGDQ